MGLLSHFAMGTSSFEEVGRNASVSYVNIDLPGREFYYFVLFFSLLMEYLFKFASSEFYGV